MTAHPPDELARRQIREQLDRNFLVEAGAGTGKTTALVDRVISLVLGGRRIERIVAITFTEKAAAELRERVRSGLEARLSDGATEAERASIEAALGSLDRAQISTIHAFCLAVLRQSAPELGIDPAFEVHDEVMAERRFEEVWRLRLEAMGADAAARIAVNRVLDLGLTVSDIGVLARSLWERSELAPLLRQRPLEPPAAVWPDLAAVVRRLRALRPEAVIDSDLLKPRIEALIASIDDLVTQPGRRESNLAAMVGLLRQSFNVGKQENWGGSSRVAEVRTTAAAAVDALKSILEALRGQALANLLPYVVDFVLDDTRERGQQGKLVFDDLILRARDLVRDIEHARNLIRDRFDCLLIDEFQDTDPNQVEIATLISTDPASGEMDPGRLFLVGDPKQSIYRFRRADMAVYSKTRATFETIGAALPELTRNRRSRDVIVDWVNAVFHGLIGEGGDPAIQPRYIPIEPDRSGDLRGPGVAWFGGPVDKPARDVRRDEAHELARNVRAAVDGGWQVVDRGAGQARPAAFRDIAILVPTRAILLTLERELARVGVPHRVEGGSLIYGTQDVRDAINCLSAIDDPADEVAIVAALRSPAYACSDVQIAEFKFAGGRFNYLQGNLDAVEGRVAESLRDLARLHYSRHRGSLAGFVERFLAERALAEISVLDQGSRNGFRRARFLVEQARAFEAGGPESIRAFVTWLERRAGQAVLDNEGAGLDDDEDAVRVLTVHAAKGLEFPIVFLAGLGVAPRGDTRVFGIDRDTLDISVTIGAAGRGQFGLGPVTQISAQEARHLQAERDRLLYVATTRARDHLVVSLYHKLGNTDSAAARLIANGATDHAAELRVPVVAVARPLGSVATLQVDGTEPIEGFEERRAALVAGSRKQRYTSATALFAEAERSDETEPWARGRGGTHVGRAVHAALQAVSWDAGDTEIQAIAMAQAVAEAVPGRAAEIAALVRSALSTDAAARARSAARALREVPFGVPFDDVVVEGFADVVLEGPDGIEIIDWKTDDVSAASARDRLASYELQAGLYALGIERAAGRSVSRITYVFVRPALELSPGDPRLLAEHALERIAREN